MALKLIKIKVMEFKKIKLSATFLLIIIAMFFGALSSVLALIIIGAGNFKMPFIGKINYADSNLGGNVVIEQPRNVVIEQDQQLTRVENDLLPTVFNIYPIKKGTDVLSKAYLESEALGRGINLTADGWFLTTSEAVKDLKANYYLVGYQSKKYQSEYFTEDKSAGLVFGKISGASNLPVAKLGSASDLTLGQTLVLISSRNSLELVNISKIGYSAGSAADLILSSDKLEKRIFLNRTFDKFDEGSVLANLKGEVVGIVSGGSAIPVDYFSKNISQVLEKKQVARPLLGIEYLDLAQIDGTIEIADKGAYVAKDPIKGFAAYGLVKKGDLIKKVNDYELNAFFGLEEAVNKYRPGDRVDLLLLRDGKDLTIPIVFK